MNTNAFVGILALALGAGHVAGQHVSTIGQVGTPMGHMGGTRIGFANPYAVPTHATIGSTPLNRAPIATFPPLGVQGHASVTPSHAAFTPGAHGTDAFLGATTSGLTFGGAIVGDRFRVGLHAGSSVGHFQPFHRFGFSWFPHSYGFVGYGYPYYGYPYYGSPYYGYPPYATPDGYYAPVDPSAMQAPAPVPQPATELKTDLDWAHFAMHEGLAGDAVDSFKLHLADNPDDVAAMRELAVGLLEIRRPREAMAMIELAHRANPEVGARPIGAPDDLGGDEALRKALRTAVSFAHEDKSEWAWFMVAVMMQTEHRPKALTLEMLRRAEDAGLDRSFSAPVERMVRD